MAYVRSVGTRLDSLVRAVRDLNEALDEVKACGIRPTVFVNGLDGGDRVSLHIAAEEPLLEPAEVGDGPAS